MSSLARLARVRASCAASGGCTVGLVVRPDDSIPGHERAAWLQEALPGETIRALHAASPLPPFKAVLALDGASLAWATARGLPAATLPPDPRAPAPEVVRRDPMRYWEELLPQARPHFVRRVRLIGPESTGKTTLAEALAARFETVWVPEASRALYAQKGFRFVYNDVAEVAWAQLEAEETAAREANRVLICDTDALSTLVYARHYFGQAPRLLGRLAGERRYSATLLCAPDLPYVPDPVRDAPEVRDHLFEVFREELQARGVAYIEIAGTGDARTEAAVRAVEEVLAAPEPE